MKKDQAQRIKELTQELLKLLEEDAIENNDTITIVSLIDELQELLHKLTN